MLRVGIYGAAGYAGRELLGILSKHPDTEVAFATSDTHAGKLYADVYPCAMDYRLVASSEAPLEGVDVIFLCTPHGVSAPLAAKALDAGAKCVDLSADLRLKDGAVYAAWYGTHPEPALLGKAVYGLTEIYREQIAEASLVANPGCYPTGVLLALWPLLGAGILADDRIIVDAKSGVSGAGAKPTETTHFVSVHDNLWAYKVGHAHRHVPEIEQELQSYRMLGQPAARALRVVFSPHLLPVSRGILSTIYINVDPSWSEEAIHDLWCQVYAGEPFVQVLDVGRLASLAHVVHTNRCALSIASAGAPGEYVLVAAIDNLVKGASGQAVQNMNIMFGLAETLGLLD